MSFFKTRYKSNSVVATLLLSAFLGFGGGSCRTRISQVKSEVNEATSAERARWETRWTNARTELKKKYQGELHREIIDKVISKALIDLYNPQNLGRTKTQIYVLNSLPGTGKTQFVKDLAQYMGLIDEDRYYPRTLGKNITHMDAEPLERYGIDSDDLKSPNYTVVPAFALYDEYTHATPLGGVASATSASDIAAAQEVVKRKLTEISSLIEVLSRRIEDSEVTNPQDAAEYNVVKDGLISLKKAQELYEAENTKLNDAKGNLTESIKKRTKEEQSAIQDLRSLWTALGSGDYAKELSETETNELQSDLQELSYELASIKQKMAISRSSKSKLQQDVEDERARLLTVYQNDKGRLRKQALEKWEKEKEEALKKFDDDRLELEDKRKTEEAESAERADSLSSFSKSSFGGYKPPPPVFYFRPPPTDNDLKSDTAWLEDQTTFVNLRNEFEGSNGVYTNLIKQRKDLIQSQTPLLERYLDAYPNALNILDSAVRSETEQPFFDVTKVVEADHLRSIGATPGQFNPNTDIGANIKEVLADWPTIRPVDRLKAYFAEFPAEFFEVNKRFISGRGKTKTSYTGHIVLFLASNVFSVQNAIERKIENPRMQYDVCKEELLKEDLGTWRKLSPDRRDPSCYRRLVAEIAESDEAKQSMRDSLFMLFGSKMDEFKDNIAALQSRAGGDPAFLLPPSSKDYGVFVDYELNLVVDTIREIFIKNYPQFKPPEVTFTNTLRLKLFEDQIDALKGYRGLQNSISSLVLEAVQERTTSLAAKIVQARKIADDDRAFAAEMVQKGTPIPGHVAMQVPNFPTTVVFDYDAKRQTMTAKIDDVQVFEIETRLKRVTAENIRSLELERKAVTRYAARLAGEVTLSALLFWALPGYDVNFRLDQKGFEERLTRPIVDWQLEPSENWIAQAYNILLYYAGSSTDILFHPGDSLPDTLLRQMQSETLIRELHMRLRKSAKALIIPGASEEAKAAMYPEKIIKPMQTLTDASERSVFTIFDALASHAQEDPLTQLGVDEVKLAAQKYMYEYSKKHLPLLRLMVRNFTEIVDDALQLKTFTPGEIYTAILNANNQLEPGMQVSANILRRMNPESSKNYRLGRFNNPVGDSEYLNNREFELNRNAQSKADKTGWSLSGFITKRAAEDAAKLANWLGNKSRSDK